MQYDSEKLAEMCAGFDLLEYVSQEYDVKMKNGEGWIKCPFHPGDDTPSLAISPDKNKFYCFGCGAKGSAIDWIIRTRNVSFDEAVAVVAKYTTTDLSKIKQCDAIKFYKQMERIKMVPRVKKIARNILPDDFYLKFTKAYPIEWIKEGITESMMDKYEIRIDQKSNRIVYPVYDSSLNLIGAKGRTRFENYKVLGIAKYMNYVKIGTIDYFQGMKQNNEAIAAHNEMIIFEGIKSCMKADSWGYDWCVAAETSCLSDGQIDLILGLGIRSIVIAFDSDAKWQKIAENLKLLKKMTNVYVIQDQHHLLGEKESPVDRTKDVWERLYAERRKLV